MSQSILPCDLKLGYTPTIFVVGRRQSITIYSGCKGIARWEVANTDDWKSEESKQPNAEGYYSYRLHATWHEAVADEEGIRFHFRPLPEEESEPATISLAVIVEDSRYPRPARGSAIPPRLLALRALTFALWAATAALGLWVLAIFVLDIWPAILLALTPQMGAAERSRLYGVSWNLWLIVLSIGWLGLVILGAEYHRKRVGQRASWRLLAVTLAVEGVIIAAAQLAY